MQEESPLPSQSESRKMKKFKATSNNEQENGLCKQKSFSDLKITYSVKIFRA
jgi:hypothetical protein